MICKKKSDELRNSWCAFIDSHRLQLHMLRVISGTQLPDFVSVQSPKGSDKKKKKKTRRLLPATLETATKFF